MLDRNRRIKKCPERFQECREQFDIIVTVEERVYDQVLEYMESRDVVDNRPVHIFNVDIEDNHEEALMGAFLITDMINMVKFDSNSYSVFIAVTNVFGVFGQLTETTFSGFLLKWPFSCLNQVDVANIFEINDKTICFIFLFKGFSLTWFLLFLCCLICFSQTIFEVIF